MKIEQFVSALVLTTCLWGSAAADNPKVQRSVGADGVTSITIKANKTQAKSQTQSIPSQVQARKAFKVYQLDGEARAERAEAKIIVVSAPPPIAPSPGYGYGYPYAQPFAYNNFYHNSFQGNYAPYGSGSLYNIQQSRGLQFQANYRSRCR